MKKTIMMENIEQIKENVDTKGLELYEVLADLIKKLGEEDAKSIFITYLEQVDFLNYHSEINEIFDKSIPLSQILCDKFLDLPDDELEKMMTGDYDCSALISYDGWLDCVLDPDVYKKLDLRGNQLIDKISILINKLGDDFQRYRKDDFQARMDELKNQGLI
tara:strand:- start:1144 stop:1629 length:486 start_codon:yes stop_codon:yes gene_type:complete